MRGHKIDVNLYLKQFILLNGDVAFVPQIMQNIPLVNEIESILVLKALNGN